MSKADYTDWKLGITKDIGGWVFGASYVDTNAHGSCGKGEFYCFPNSSGSKTQERRQGHRRHLGHQDLLRQT